MRVDSQTSVIIVNWNGRVHLTSCLTALSKQTLKPHEIIVVDNASSDDSVDFIKLHYSQIKLIELNENTGFSGGNNAGYAVASGDYIVLLNNDTKPLPDWLEQLVACADAHSDVGIVASLMTDWAGELIDTAGDACSVTGRGYHLKKGRQTAEPIASRYVFSACAGAALYKRTMLEQIGFLDNSFFMNAEDTDLAFRAQLSGWKTYFCAASVVRHRISASQGKVSERSVYYNARNHLRSYFKCMPTGLILKYGALLLVEAYALLLYNMLRGTSLAYSRGIIAGLKSLPEVLHERESVKRMRHISTSDLERMLSWPRSVEVLKRQIFGPA